MGQGMAPAHIPSHRGPWPDMGSAATSQGSFHNAAIPFSGYRPFLSPPSPWRPSARPAMALLPQESSLAATVTDYIHLLAAAFWVGGLFGLALILPVVFSLFPRGQCPTGHPCRPPSILSCRRTERRCPHSSLASIAHGRKSPSCPRSTVPYGQTLVIAKTVLVGVLLGLRSDQPSVADPRHPRRSQGSDSVASDCYRRGNRRSPRDSCRSLPHEP